MNTIDVCLTTSLIPHYEIEKKVVVIVDILRATSCIVTALAHDAASVKPIPNSDQCRSMKSNGYIISGERNGKKIPGFDKGNSPSEYTSGDMKGADIALTTTNGTTAIEMAKKGEQLLIGSFLNMDALTRHLLMVPSDILIVCSGWKGKINLEDTLFAGALIEKLKKYIAPDCDTPIMAQQLYLNAKQDMITYLSRSSHFERLKRLDRYDDIKFCLTPNKYSVIPILRGDVLVSL